MLTWAETKPRIFKIPVNHQDPPVQVRALTVTSYAQYFELLKLYDANNSALGVSTKGLTWNIVYIMTVSGRFPENSEILKTLRPHLFACSSSCQQMKETDVLEMKKYGECLLKTVSLKIKK